MKKITVIVVLVMIVLIATPGYSDSTGFKKFVEEVRMQKKESGFPELALESSEVIIVIFALEKVMKKFQYYKGTDIYKVNEIRKFDESIDQTPQERLQEALAVYGIGETTK